MNPYRKKIIAPIKAERDILLEEDLNELERKERERKIEEGKLGRMRKDCPFCHKRKVLAWNCLTGVYVCTFCKTVYALSHIDI